MTDNAIVTLSIPDAHDQQGTLLDLHTVLQLKEPPSKFVLKCEAGCVTCFPRKHANHRHEIYINIDDAFHTMRHLIAIKAGKPLKPAYGTPFIP